MRGRLQVLRYAFAVALVVCFTPPMFRPAERTAGEWRLTGDGYEAVRVSRNCWHSRDCVLVSGSAAAPEGSYGNLYRIVPADTRLSRRVRFRAAVRVEGVATRARLWLRLDRANGGVVFQSSPEIAGGAWIDYQIEAEIPPGSHRIAIGLLLTGPGKAWIEDAGLVDVRPRRPSRDWRLFAAAPPPDPVKAA